MRSPGVLVVRQDNAEKKGTLFQCPDHGSNIERNLRPAAKARGKSKGATKERTRDRAASLNPSSSF